MQSRALNRKRQTVLRRSHTTALETLEPRLALTFAGMNDERAAAQFSGDFQYDVHHLDGNLAVAHGDLIYNSRTVADSTIHFEGTLIGQSEDGMSGARPLKATGDLYIQTAYQQTFYWNVDQNAQVGQNVVFGVPWTFDTLPTDDYDWSLQVTYEYPDGGTAFVVYGSPPHYYVD